jgi:hypothetical protein
MTCSRVVARTTLSRTYVEGTSLDPAVQLGKFVEKHVSRETLLSIVPENHDVVIITVLVSSHKSQRSLRVKEA